MLGKTAPAPSSLGLAGWSQKDATFIRHQRDAARGGRAKSSRKRFIADIKVFSIPLVFCHAFDTFPSLFFIHAEYLL